MKILVLGGSPKGNLSVTMEHVRFLESRFPQAKFIFTQPGQQIRRLERDSTAFNALLQQIAEADGLLFGMPVYYTLIPSGFKRFIELVNERNRQECFKGKPAIILLTSIQYHDEIAANYLEGICSDWGADFVRTLSLGMREIFSEKGQKKLLFLGESLLDEIASTKRRFTRIPPLPATADWEYTPEITGKKIADMNPKSLAVLIDQKECSPRLQAMIDKFLSQTNAQAKVYCLEDLLEGPCLGCMKCGADNICAYTGKDGYIEAFKEWMQTDILLLAGKIEDRFLSAIWKTAFDRSFWRTHQPNFEGKKIVALISGPYSQLTNLQEFFMTFSEAHEADLVGVVSDEAGDSAVLDGQLEALAADLDRALEKNAPPACTFRRTGGMKIFRDELAGGLKLIFRQDHRTYRKMGNYDFPLRNPFKAFGLYIGYLLTGIPFIKEKLRKDMPKLMIREYPRLYKKK